MSASSPQVQYSPYSNGSTICDSVAQFIYCPKHKTVALTKTKKGLWLPLAIVEANDGLTESCLV